jgi:prepilin-type N-terminal cleavage/methylation domain-containing protein
MRTAALSKGFSLPEVVVALAVFGIASTALLATVLLNVRSNRISNEISEATTLAQSWVEYVRAQTITDGVARRAVAPTSVGSM